MARNKIDDFKVDYILRNKYKFSKEHEKLEMIKNGDYFKSSNFSKTKRGIFENLGFCIFNYFKSHYYLGHKAICQLGDIAEIELVYRPKEAVKFMIYKIRLLKSFGIFDISDANPSFNRMIFDLERLVIKINQKVDEEFNISVSEVMAKEFPADLLDFETYEQHQEEHRQLNKILKYLKQFLKVMIIQTLYEKFIMRKMEESEVNRFELIHKIEYNDTKKEISISTSNPSKLSPFSHFSWHTDFNIPVFKIRNRYGLNNERMPSNRLKFKCENLKEIPNSNNLNSFKNLLVSITTFNYDSTLREDTDYYFIDSILQIDQTEGEADLNPYLTHPDFKELRPANINWKNVALFDFQSGSIDSDIIFTKLIRKASQTNLYTYASRMKKRWKAFDPGNKVVDVYLTYKKVDNPPDSMHLDYEIGATMVIYNSLTVSFGWRELTGQFYITNSSFLDTKQINILNEFVSTIDFTYIEIKTLVQIFWTHYFCKEFCEQMQQYCLHTIKSDKLIFHFSVKKAKCVQIKRTKNDIWDIAQKSFNLSDNLTLKLKCNFYGNHLYVLLSPFDSMVSLPLFNPSSIIKADKTYNFITVEIPWDFLPQGDPRRPQFSPLPSKIEDVELKFIYGRLFDHEEAKLDESFNFINIENDLGLQPEETFATQTGDIHVIKKLVKELVVYYKRNDQIKSMQTLFSKVSNNIEISANNKRLVISNFNFDTSFSQMPPNESLNDFKPLKMFNDIFKPNKLEIRNECKTWIFNVTNERAIMLMNGLRERLNIKYFKNFLMDVDVSVVVDLVEHWIIITYERSTKYKGFIELARQVAKIFDILIGLDLMNKDRMMNYLKHYINGKTKEFLVFQIPLSKDCHLNPNLQAASFSVTYNEKNLIQQHKIDSQASTSLNVQISPNFSQSFLLWTLKKDISNIGSILTSLDNSIDTLVEFNEYILGRILYPSIIDGEDKYNVTFVTRTKDELTIYYRDFFALDILFPKEPKRKIFQFQIYDKAQSVFYSQTEDLAYNILPIPGFQRIIKRKIEEILHGKDFWNDSKYIDFRTSVNTDFHLALKIIFDYLACLYIIRKLQNNFQPLEMEDHINYEVFELNLNNEKSKFLNKLIIRIVFERMNQSKHVMIKGEPNTNEHSNINQLQDFLGADNKWSFLTFRLIPINEGGHEMNDKNSIRMKEVMRVYEEFFEKKVRHKFYCWKYVRGFIYIFTTPIFYSLKPYELLNIELRQAEGDDIVLIRKNDPKLQNLLDKRQLHSEILLQTLIDKKNDPNRPDVEFKIRLHDNKERDYYDVHIKTKNKFNEILIGDRESKFLIEDIFELMTMNLSDVKTHLEGNQN